MSSPVTGPARARILERRAIDFVPEIERHGTIHSLFTLFFVSNLQITAVAVGLIPRQLGLGFTASLAAIVVGNLLGALVMAAHAAQGPRIGIPQMIQSRAQFGVLGANVPLAFVVVMYLGFFSGSAILGGSALAQLFGLRRISGIIAMDALTVVLLALGHDAIHRYARWTTWLIGGVFLFATIRATGLYAQHGAAGSAAGWPRIGTWFMGMSLFATWQITYGPYVADYSRYLPASTSGFKVFASTYAGSALGSIWAMTLGALLGAVAHGLAMTNPTAAFAALIGGAGPGGVARTVALATVVAGILIANSLNLYGGSLSTLTILSTNRRWHQGTLRHGRWYRLGLGISGAVIGTVVAALGAGRVLGFLNDLLLLLMYVFVPWSAINLTDFFLVRHGTYSIVDIYDRAGRYGAWGADALWVLAASIAAEVPFMNLPFFVGPVARWLGGADVTWIVGLSVAAPAYWYRCRTKKLV